MCRALLYLGEPVLLDSLLFQPDSALVRQAYMPKMLNLLNLAGFGLRAWDPGSHAPEKPYFYASPSLPVFDRNLKTLAVLRQARERLGIALSSSVNLFIANGSQLAAVRYCFDFGCYRTDDPARVHEANLSYLSLWYTLGRDYGLHDGEWKMSGGAEHADSIIVASEPLTRATSAWVQLPEYGALFAEVRAGRPRLSLRLLD